MVNSTRNASLDDNIKTGLIPWLSYHVQRLSRGRIDRIFCIKIKNIINMKRVNMTQIRGVRLRIDEGVFFIYDEEAVRSTTK